LLTKKFVTNRNIELAFFKIRIIIHGMKRIQIKNKWKQIKPWLGIAVLGSAGLIPCPDCGAPMIFHFWPIALILAFVNLRKLKRSPQMDHAEGNLEGDEGDIDSI
jgi:hypothetical protein